jgi:protein-S-isoprenylcysteine O-methyltransferase Ste14
MTKTAVHPNSRLGHLAGPTTRVFSFRLKRPRSNDARRSPQGWDVRTGRALFRFRSYSLIPLVLLLGVLYVQSAIGTWSVPAWGLGASLLILGETVRFYIAGHARPGTSGRGTTIRAAVLVTDGPYAATRNPLYFANWLQWLGAAAVTGVWWAPPFFAAVVALQYHFIIRAEESFLAGEFGPAFRPFQNETPRFIPRPSLRFFSGEFDFRKALFREHDTMFLVFLGLWTLPVISSTLHGTPIRPWGTVGACAAFGWAITKAVKKRSRRLNESPRAVTG